MEQHGVRRLCSSTMAGGFVSGEGPVQLGLPGFGVRVGVGADEVALPEFGGTGMVFEFHPLFELGPGVREAGVVAVIDGAGDGHGGPQAGSDAAVGLNGCVDREAYLEVEGVDRAVKVVGEPGAGGLAVLGFQRGENFGDAGAHDLADLVG